MNSKGGCEHVGVCNVCASVAYERAEALTVVAACSMAPVPCSSYMSDLASCDFFLFWIVLKLQILAISASSGRNTGPFA